MSAHISFRRGALRPAMGRALLAFVATALVTAIGCLWAAAVTPAGSRTVVAACLGVAAVVVCVAVASATYSEQEARRWRDRVAAMDASVARPRNGVGRHVAFVGQHAD